MKEIPKREEGAITKETFDCDLEIFRAFENADESIHISPGLKERLGQQPGGKKTEGFIAHKKEELGLPAEATDKEVLEVVEKQWDKGKK